MLYINDYLLLKQALFNSYKELNKDKMPNFKNNLLMPVLKEQKSKIVDKICDNFILNNKNNEYGYFEFIIYSNI